MTNTEKPDTFFRYVPVDQQAPVEIIPIRLGDVRQVDGQDFQDCIPLKPFTVPRTGYQNLTTSDLLETWVRVNGA